MQAADSIVIAPSLLSADFGDLAGAVAAAEAGGAQWLHLDVMDGHFVPNITFGPLVIEGVRRLTRLPLDVHLMIAPPEPHLEAFARAGADRLTVHWEATPHVHRALQRIKELGVKAGIAVNPGTPWQVVEPVLDDVDLVLVMTVNPGFGGQRLIAGCLDKVSALRRRCRERGLAPWIQVDGGIDLTTAALAVRAGADVLVAGSAVYGAADPAEQVRALHRAAVAAAG